MLTTEITFNRIVFTVRLDPALDNAVTYRDKAHLGGPWSDAIGTIANPSIDLKFRRSLRKAAQDLSSQVDL